MGDMDDKEIVFYAALSSKREAGNQDAIDFAVTDDAANGMRLARACAARGFPLEAGEEVSFEPFNPTSKRVLVDLEDVGGLPPALRALAEGAVGASRLVASARRGRSSVKGSSKTKSGALMSPPWPSIATQTVALGGGRHDLGGTFYRPTLLTGVTPAIRANDTTDIWLPRGASYAKEMSRPWRTASLKHVRKFCDLGLYSVTFNNDLDHDYATVEAYHAFRADAVHHKFRHFLEVFNPNAPKGLDPKVMPFYVNDMIMRVLAGVAAVERPLFLKMPFNGRKAMEELASHDPGLVIGILGGSAGTTRDCFELLSQGEKSGARVALFGRKINLAESPLDLVALFRPVLERKVTAAEAVKSYHATLAKKNLKPKRALEDDMKITEAVLEGYGK
jgi:hypothetical protein